MRTRKDRSVSTRISALLLPLLLTGICSTQVSAQSLTDALRLTREGIPIGVRNAGLDGAAISAVNDYTALAWNPAALAPIEWNEVGLSLFDREHNSDADYLGTTSTDLHRSTSFSSLGFVYPFKTKQGHLSMAMSFDKERDYNASYRFNAVNPNSSLINTSRFLDDPHQFGSSNYENYLDNNNLAWALYLTYGVDSANPNLATPIKSGLQQTGRVTEEGGLYAFRVGAGVDIAPNVSLGATVSLYTGTYDYRRVYSETDVNGIFANDTGLPPHGFQSVQITDMRHQTQTGAGFKLGLLATPFDILQLGVTVETPDVYHIEDEFSRRGISTFAGNKVYETGSDLESPVVNSYDITTPWRFGAGASVHLLGAMLSGDISYSDMTQLTFDNEASDLSSLNDDAQTILRPTLSWHIGAEYVIAPLGTALRAGIGREPSSYVGDAVEYDSKSLALGFSVLLSKSVVLEGSYQNVKYRTDHTVYNDVTPEGVQVNAVIPRDDVSRDQFMLGFGYRF